MEVEGDARIVHECMCLMSGRYPKQPVDAAFVFGRAQGDYEQDEAGDGILELAAELFHRQLVSWVVLAGVEGTYTAEGEKVTTSYPGKSAWTARLVDLGVASEVIAWTGEEDRVRAEGIYHTKREGDEYVQLAKQRGWKSAVALAHTHQFFRMMLGLIQSLKVQQYLELQIVPVAPRTVSWKKLVFGSQGALCLQRSDHIDQEWSRIHIFQSQGDLASMSELFRYLTL